jgi:spore maturation protein CgeB
MKLLLYHWASYFENDIHEILQDEGVNFDFLTWDFTDKNHDDRFLFHIEHNVDMTHYDALFSVNYWPLLSEICQKANIPYIAWCYDNPLNVRDIQKTLGNSVNRVYCFDQKQVEGYRKQGFENVYHLTLGVNSKRLSKISNTDPKCIPYRSQVSFIGKLYESAADAILSSTDDYCKGYLQAVMNAQQDLYGAYLIDQAITEEFIEKINMSFQKRVPGTKFVLQRDELIFALSSEITRRDRIILLSLIGSRFQTKFYSYNNSSIIKGVEKCDAVDYFSEMPYIFAASKINLNPSLRAIQTGIPLRALDIMGCGGFLLSNYQQELAELFEYGTEMIMYDSMPDALEKVGYYLSHEDERAKIALNGRKKTLYEYNMKDRLAHMLNSPV